MKTLHVSMIKCSMVVVISFMVLPFLSTEVMAKAKKPTSDKKVILCHIPPGNLNNPQTITISKNALNAHLAHGDSEGACSDGGGMGSDGDNDGIPDADDNCPVDMNPDQADADDDGLGDVCDPTPLPEPDTDGDGTPDSLDECPNNPGRITSDADGCTPEVSGSVAEGELLTLELTGDVSQGTLTIPADALPTGMTVTLAEVDPSTLVPPPNITNEAIHEELMTPVYALLFSETLPATHNMVFTFQIPSVMTNNIYLRFMIKGGIGFEESVDTDWEFYIPDYDSDLSTFTIDFSATAEKILIVGIHKTRSNTTSFRLDRSAPPTMMSQRTPNTHTDVTPPEETPPEETMGESLLLGLLNVAGEIFSWIIPSAHAATETAGFDQYGWAIVCVFDGLYFVIDEEDPFPAGCDQGLMPKLGDEILANVNTLGFLGFPEGKLEVLTLRELEVAGNPFHIHDPLGRSTHSSPDPSDRRYFVVYLEEKLIDNFLGVYFAGTGKLKIKRPLRKGIPIHELFHAAHYAVAPDTWNIKFLVEGAASAMMPFASDNDDGMGTEYRYLGGDWRDWSKSLKSVEGLNEYQATEFWYSLDESLGYLKPLFLDLVKLGPINAATQLLAVEDALLSNNQGFLTHRYEDLIQNRNDDLRYPYCKTCTGEDCNVQVVSTAMSAQCWDMQFLCDEPTTTITLNGQSSHKLMVDGELYNTSTEVPVNETARVWVIDENLLAGRPSQLEVKCSADVELISQSHDVRVHANTHNAFTPSTSSANTEERYIHLIDSHEDLSLQSTETLAQFTTSQGNTDTQNVIEPLNQQSWGEFLEANAEYIPDPPPCCPDLFSDLSAYAVAETFLKSTHTDTGITTEGIQEADSSQQGHRTTGSTAGGTARVASNYGYHVAKTTDLIVSWGCDTSIVNIEMKNLANDEIVELLKVTNDTFLPDWECGSKSWVIPSFHEVNVTIETRHEATLSEGSTTTTRYYENKGGQYKIELIPQTGE